MAAEISVSDVLCEAMEYLSKLGSNLKTRTDNLKEKKIRKDKLKNSHSVQKAANKVLLICELSKRSLENVEKGVRSILSKVNTEQMPLSFGGKSGDSEKTILFQQFEYCSRTLRICKTVPIKHYMSVKVHARNMSLSMQDKYPVYYDCKLYRKRKRSMRKTVEQIGMDGGRPEILSTPQNEDSCIDNANNSDTPYFLSSNEIPNNKKIVELSQDAEKKTNSLGTTFTSTQTVNLSETLLLEPIDHNKNNEHESVIQNIHRLDEQKFGNTHEQTTLVNRGSKAYKPAMNDEIIKNNLGVESDSSDKEQIKVGDNIRSKKQKFARILNDSSDENEDIQINDSNIKLSTEVSTEKHDTIRAKNELPLETEKNSLCKSNEENDIITELSIIDSNLQPVTENDKTCDDTEKSEESAIPQIKCVNIFKLLKPDIVNNLQNKPENSKKSVKYSQDRINKNLNTTNLEVNSLEKSKENELLNKKRKEVLAFKAKKFVIKVHKLPPMSVELLHKYKLKRITQNGSVICHLDLLNEHKIKEAEKVKNDLLNDSDSDDVTIKRLSTEGKKVKNALLYDSDSDNQESNNKNESISERPIGEKSVESEAQIIDSENINKSNEDISNSHSSKQQITMTEISRKNSNIIENISIENIKISLLNDSDIDVPDTEVINDLISGEISNSSKDNVDKGTETKNMLLELSNKDNHIVINEIEISDEPKSKSIQDNIEITSEKNTLVNSKESNTCTNSVTLDYQKSTDHNTSNFSDKNDCLNKEMDLANKNIEDTCIKESNSQLNIDENMRSQNELQCTDGNKNVTDDIEKLKDALLCESDSDNDHSHIGNKNKFKGVKRKLSLNVNKNSKSVIDTEVTSNVDSHKSSMLRCSDSDEKETNKLSSEKNNDNDSGESEGSTKVNKTNIKETDAGDGKVDSGVNENESKTEISPNKIKSSLLNSSDDSQNGTKKSKSGAKVRRKRKHLRERIKAKKMLMTYTSSSDDDDGVPSRKKCKDPKNVDNLITEIADEIEVMKQEQKMIGSISSSSRSSDEDLLQSVKKKKHSEPSKPKREGNSDEESLKGSHSAVQECQNVAEKSCEHSDSGSSQV